MSDRGELSQIMIEACPGCPEPHIDLFIDRGTIARQDVKAGLTALTGITQGARAARVARSRLRLYVDGYDNDARELWCIPEVKRYVAALSNGFRYWFWFVDPTGSTLLLLAACACETTRVFQARGKPAVTFEPESLKSFWEHHIAGVAAMAARYGADQSAVDELLAPIGRYFGYYPIV